MRNPIIEEDLEFITGSNLPWDALEGKNILITGANGFVPAYLVETILFLNETRFKKKAKVFALIRNKEKALNRFAFYKSRTDLIFVVQDVTEPVTIKEDIHFIIHAAANPDNRMHASDPLKTMDVISRGTDAVLNAALRLPNLKKSLNISSELIYGAQPLELDAIAENFRGGPDCGSVASVYVEAKRFAETLCSAYRSQYKLAIVTARPFAFIGPYQFLDKPWAVNNFIRDSLMGGPIRILGDGETVRSYMYPSDMAFWILRILFDGTSGLAYNVGSPHGMTLLQLAEKITGNFPIQPKIISRVAIDSDLNRSRLVPDVTLAQKNLGLNLTIDIDEAIRRTLLWYRENGIKGI